ncbi:TonB-dependent receptor domain-containing protein [Shewanella gelidii]|uniref:TonB-dependent receptor n=1 Tax=Shewanella gelidii TaxID=1642821 RepID=A0A917N703_9GAMM|nr:TonB-dependent receptor [Shewanella gelidii]MCL1097102.1 TonB-dependent receptor [Shewanella gelidii]GGI72601.1 TonB-dependent receptor [Shewanella gelidii]
MLKRGFRLSASAAAVLMVCQPAMAAEESELAASVADAFHYQSNREAIAFLPGVTVFSGASSVTPFISHGAASGIAVLQDRIYYSPAPYSSPGTWSQPVKRQQSIAYSATTDVRLGGQGAAGALAYKTQSIGQDKLKTTAALEGNSQAGGDLDLAVNVKNRDYGMLFTVDHAQRDLTQEFRNDAELDMKSTQIMFKMDAESLPGARNYQKTEFKYQYENTEQSDSIVGTTFVDWELEPTLNYSATARDQADSTSHRYQLSHQVNTNKYSQVLTEFYYLTEETETARLNSLSGSLIQDAQLAQLSSFDREPTVLGLSLGSLVDARDMRGAGVQTQMLTKYQGNDISYSARYHTDSSEVELGHQNMQWMFDRSLLVVDDAATILTYKDSANVLTLAADTDMKWGPTVLTLGLGYERVDVERKIEANAFGLSNTDFSDSNWLPSIGIAYDVGHWHIGADVSRPWVAATAGNQEELAQESLHYQISGHYQTEQFKIGLNIYMQDFDNLHTGCDGFTNCSAEQLASQYNIADVMSQGAELSFVSQWQFGEVLVPLNLTYQYDNSEYQQTQCGLNGPISCAIEGERLAWVPEQQIALNVGMKMDAFAIYANAFYQSERELRDNLTQSRMVPEQWRVDIAASYQIAKSQQVYARVENVLDEDLIARHSGSGVISEQGQVAYLGYKISF